MNNKLNEAKNNIVLPVVIILVFIIIIIVTGVSYAWFTSNVSGNSTSGTNTVQTVGSLSLVLTDGPEVSGSNWVPGSYVEKTFTVKNNASITTKYYITLVDVVNTFVDKTDLEYKIESSDGGYNMDSPSELIAENGAISEEISIAPNTTHTYKLTITFKYLDEDQSDNMGKRFTGKVNISDKYDLPKEAYTYIGSSTTETDELDSTWPVYLRKKAGTDEYDICAVEGNKTLCINQSDVDFFSFTDSWGDTLEIVDIESSKSQETLAKLKDFYGNDLCGVSAWSNGGYMGCGEIIPWDEPDDEYGYTMTNGYNVYNDNEAALFFYYDPPQLVHKGKKCYAGYEQVWNYQTQDYDSEYRYGCE